jgi:hypothetical protein
MPTESTPQLRRGQPLATTLGIVIALGMCGCAVSMALAVMAANLYDEDITIVESEFDDTVWEFDPSTADDRLASWAAWSPDVAEMLGSPPQEKLSLIEEGAGVVAPGLVVQESVWRDGYYDADQDWSYADLVLARASTPAEGRISAAVEFYLQSDQMVADGVAFEAVASDVVDTLSDGRELLYRPRGTDQWRSFGDPAFDELWRAIASDWPDAVVMEIAPWSEGSDTWWVKFTTWSAYAIEEMSPHVYATYQSGGDGAWELTYWEYRYPGAP